VAEAEDDMDDDDIICLEADEDMKSWSWLVFCCCGPRLEKVRLLPLFYDKKSEGAGYKHMQLYTVKQHLLMF